MNAPKIPTAIENVLPYLRNQSLYVEMALRNRSEDTTARDSIILLSPDGSAWEIKVNNAGALTTTKVYGGS